jgi:putative NIF3 family GTP cyclohydrolase 1 type 2
MRAGEVLAHFLSVCEWVDPARTVDRIIIGDPEAEISRVLVTWISDFRALRAAAERGCQLVVTHEPTFWAHRNELAAVGEWKPGSARHQIAARKRRFVEDHGLVILRLHDCWDRMPEIGIPWAWARFLGLGEKPAAVAGDGYQHRYDVSPLPLEEFARQLAARTAALGEPAVQVVGDGARLISRVGVGTGCACDPLIFQEMGCDVSVVCDDGNWYWESIQCAADADHPVIRVNHGTSEEPGMVTLTSYLSETFPELRAEHFPHGSCFRLVGKRQGPLSSSAERSQFAPEERSGRCEACGSRTNPSNLLPGAIACARPSWCGAGGRGTSPSSALISLHPTCGSRASR